MTESPEIEMVEATLSCRQLGASYGPITVCREVDIEVHKGQIVCLIGPNGAGKTSTARAIAGLIRNSGQIRLEGQPLQGLSAHARAAAGLAVVPDDRALFGSLTVSENLTLGARMLPKSERDAAIEEAMVIFPIVRGLWSKTAGSLSGGEQQMLSLSKALASRPKALVLDEPSQGLAPIILDSLRESLRGLSDRGLPVLLIEQNQRFAHRAADRFYAMARGRIVLRGDASQLADRDAIAAAYLGTNIEEGQE